MKRLFLFSILLVLSACSKGASPDSTGPFQVYGIGLGATVDQVTSEFGIPDDKQIYPTGGEEEYLFYHYPRFTLGFKEDKVVFISSIDPEFGTEKDIHINDDKRKVLLNYPKEEIYCYKCESSEFDFEKMPDTFYIEDGALRLVFGGEGKKIEIIQVGHDIPKNMMFSPHLDPVEHNLSAEEIEEKSLKLDSSLIKMLTGQYANDLEIPKDEFMKNLSSEDIKEEASHGKLFGFPFPIGTPYQEIIKTLGHPDDSGVLGEGSYNLIYGPFNLAFDYRDLDGENRNTDTTVVTMKQKISERFDIATLVEQMGDSDDYFMEHEEGQGYLLYQLGDYQLSFVSEANETPDFHDDQVIYVRLKEKPNQSAESPFTSRFDFQVTGTDGKEYKLFVYSDDETVEQIGPDDVWFSHLEGSYSYSGEYSVALQETGSDQIKKQNAQLGYNTFVNQDETSTASMVYAKEGPDVLVLKQKESASLTSYKTYIVKNGEFKEIPFIYDGQAAEPYFEGFRNVTPTTWESLTFSNQSDAQWLGTTWELDLKDEVFRNNKDTKYPMQPW